jgi:hypothetical protein
MAKEEVVRSLLAHQVVVEHIMREHTVLPVRFGTILAGSEEVRGLLSQGHQQFVDALAWIGDKVEVEVAATWDTERVLREISAEPEIARGREAIASRPRQTLEDRIHLGQMVKASMDRRRDGYRERMIDFLKSVAVDEQPNALVSNEMVMNVAFLVERVQQREFDERVRELDSLFNNEVTFRVIGPLPPYSFSTVEVTRLTGQQIEEARQELELPGMFSEPEVRRAYRRLAAKEQRKALLGMDAPVDRLARLRRASEVLLACCRGRASRGDGADVSGSRATDCLFVVSIRGTGYQEVEQARFGGAVRV